MKSLFAVTIERTVFVEATGFSDAEEIALRNEKEEVCMGTDPDNVSSKLIVSKGAVPREWLESLAYGGDGKTAIEDSEYFKSLP